MGILHFDPALKMQRVQPLGCKAALCRTYVRDTLGQGRFLDACPVSRCLPKKLLLPLAARTPAAGSTHLWVVNKCALGRSVIDPNYSYCSE